MLSCSAKNRRRSNKSEDRGAGSCGSAIRDRRSPELKDPGFRGATSTPSRSENQTVRNRVPVDTISESFASKPRARHLPSPERRDAATAETRRLLRVGRPESSQWRRYAAFHRGVVTSRQLRRVALRQRVVALRQRVVALRQRVVALRQRASRYDSSASRYDNASSRYDSVASRYDNASSRYDNASSRYDSASRRVTTACRRVTTRAGSRRHRAAGTARRWAATRWRLASPSASPTLRRPGRSGSVRGPPAQIERSRIDRRHTGQMTTVMCGYRRQTTHAH